VENLKLGNIDAVRDWSHAKDIVRGMELIINHSEAGDFVLCSGQGTSVRTLLSFAFSSVGLDDWSKYVEIDPSLYRPCEVQFLQGRADKAKEVLGWAPEISFKQLVEDMVKHDLG
jgi:GDPmannose 4,6-dehydratase